MSNRHLAPGGLTTGMNNADRLRALRSRAKELGLCGECRARFPIAGKRTCEECLAKHANRTVDHRARGKCDCGRKPKNGLATCAQCAKQKSAQDKRRRDRRAADEMCTRCGKHPAAPARAECFGCLDSVLAALAVRRGWPLSRRCTVCGESGHNRVRHQRAA